MIRAYFFASFFLFASFAAGQRSLLSQTDASAPNEASPQSSSPKSAVPALPSEPAEVFALATPLYDLFSATMKPWHIKVSYQLYNDKGKPAEKGTYEYWWASSMTHRNSWTRPGMEHTDWAVEGKLFSRHSGPMMGFFEKRVGSSLLKVLPSAMDLEGASFKREDQTIGGVQLPCFLVIRAQAQITNELMPLRVLPAYCFDAMQALLRAQNYPFGDSLSYNSIVRIQGKFLTGEVTVFEFGHEVLSAKVEETDGVASSDPELVPTKDAELAFDPGIVLPRMVVKPPSVTRMVPAHFPDEGRQKGRRRGSVADVVVRLTVGTDGRPHDLNVTIAPSLGYAEEAVRAVSQYRFKPGLQGDVPVECEVSVKVNFSLL